MTRQKEEFQPRKKDHVSMYVCGPTTYNYFHVGNARMLVVFDMVRRYFLYKGYAVQFVQNFTDVDDKIIQRAQESAEEAQALGQRFIDEYFKDAQALNIMPASVHPKATEHIPEMIEIIQGLIGKGMAYQVDGDVYYEVGKFASYGKLSGRKPEDLQTRARVESDERKRSPLDFALWKKAKPGEPFWDSPWGQGRPGWHIECSAMSLKYLGPGFDIHGGGADLVFPHHENEIAQTEGYLEGQTCACYWMHNAFLTVEQEKMSKSAGNFFTVREILESFPGEVIRFYLLGTHYRSPLDFGREKLEMAQRGLRRLRTSLQLANEVLRQGVGAAEELTAQSQKLIEEAQKARKDFAEAMDDDFNSALAYAALFNLAKVINAAVNGEPQATTGLQTACETLRELGSVLGFDLEKSVSPEEDDAQRSLVDDVMGVLLQVRVKIRENKDWALADQIRDSLKDIGILLEDTPQGVRWKMK
jgi:cysteinyl-tRNA synthetase